MENGEKPLPAYAVSKVTYLQSTGELFRGGRRRRWWFFWLGLLFFLVEELNEIGEGSHWLFAFFLGLGNRLEFLRFGRRALDRGRVSGPIAAALITAAAIGSWWTFTMGRGTGTGRLSTALIRRTAALLRLPRRTRGALFARTLLLGRAVLLLRPWLLVATLSRLPFAWRPGWTFRAGGDRGERDAAAIFINIDDPDLEHVADADDFVWIANEAVGEAADVDEAAVRQANIDEDAEIDDVEDRA